MSTYRHPEELIAAAVEDYAAGMSTNQAAAKHGVSPKTVNNWVRNAGIVRNLAEAKEAENSLTGGHWMPNWRGIQVWQPCISPSIQTCTTNHQENSNAA